MTRICLGLLAAAAAWFVVNLVRPAGPAVLLWATMPLYGPLVSAVFWHTSGRLSLPPPTRRFWRHLSPVPVLVGAGQMAQAIDVLGNPGARVSYTGPVMLVFDGTAMLCLSYALIRLPTGERRGAATRTALDAATVALAATVFIWHFGTSQVVRAGVTPDVLASLILVVLAIVAVFALAKAVLADYSAITGRGLWLLAAAVLTGALAPMLQPLLAAQDGRLYVTQVSLPVIFCLGAYAAVSQWAPVTARTRPATRRRAYSVLPYTAVAAVDGLLLWETWHQGDDVVSVAFCAVVLTAVVVVRQVSALRDNERLLARLDHAASHDALTGLGNRSLFHQRLDAALAAGGVQVAVIDLDEFKEVNDTLGHEAGDLLLVSVADALRACLRPGDTAARLGGDEFVLVLAGADRAEADRIARCLAVSLREPVVALGHRLHVRASIGIAGGAAGTDPVALLRRADQAMYAAKKVAGTAHLHAA